ncbi:MAG: hypothetical protein M3N39_04525 [Pseudomonadota bacterium]|nr:hypothetical protein [Pseudomonadota bacterium]
MPLLFLLAAALGRFRDIDLLRRLFEATVQRCITKELVGGDGSAMMRALFGQR